MLYLLGYDLFTGVCVLTPLALIDKRPGVTVAGVARNWVLVFFGNFAGALTTAVMMSIVFTFGFATEPNAVGKLIAGIGEARTLGYEKYGASGMLTLFVRAMLCNWMVSTGVIGAMLSTSVPGKVIAMWMPITVFFFMTFEHSVVNMFLFPSAILMGGHLTIMDYLIWNEIPTLIGNIVGGLAFTGLMLYSTHVRTGATRMPSMNAGAPPPDRGRVGPSGPRRQARAVSRRDDGRQMSETRTVSVIVTGRVQGVSYRAWTQSEARARGLSRLRAQPR